MKLLAGQRFKLHDEDKFIRLKSGAAEVYAVTHLKESFRQIFLMELPINGAAYPSLDEFEQIDIQIYAVQDSELEILSFKEIEPLEQVNLMRAWFKNLIKLSWLRLLADKGDEILIPWINGQVLRGSEDDLDALIDDFTENEKIFAMLLGMRFEAEDKRLALRTETRNRHNWIVDMKL
jgi:ATP-binding cassette subfamily C protein